MSNLFEFLPYAIRYMQHRAEADEIMRIAGPTIAEAKKAIPELWPLLRVLAIEIAPELQQHLNIKAMTLYDVKLIQESLNKLGEELKVDGYPGTKTRKAIERFQKNHAVAVDGWAGTRTVMALGVALYLRAENGR